MADNVKLIPKKTKVQTQFYKNLTLTDAIIALAFLLLGALVLLSSYTIKIKLILGAVVGFSFVILFLRVGPETRVYQSLGDFAKYLFGVKKFKKMNISSPKSVNSLMPYAAIDDDGVIDYKEYYASVVELFPVEFYMIAPSRQ